MPKTTLTSSKRAARAVKKEVKAILAPKKSKKSPGSTISEIFYYSRRQIIALTFVYGFAAYLLWRITACALASACINITAPFAVLTMVIMLLCLAAFGSVVFVLIYPQKLAVITNESIKIDHNHPLKWSDVAYAQKQTTGILKNRPIITFTLKDGKLADYKLTFMQKICKNNVFTPFSIPLYAMEKEDAERITTLIAQHTSYK